MNKRKLKLIAIITLILAGLLSPFASSSPDGFERVAEDTNFIHLAKDNFINTIFKDYSINEGGILSTSIAGILGALLTFTFIFILMKGISKLNK